jgi:hypothetical protein
MVMRAGDAGPVRVFQRRHDRSIIAMLNSPWELKDTVRVDPLDEIMSSTERRGD